MGCASDIVGFWGGGDVADADGDWEFRAGESWSGKVRIFGWGLGKLGFVVSGCVT